MSVVPDWVPVDACRLPTAEQPLRVAEFEELFASALVGVRRLDSHLLRLRLGADPAVEPAVRDLVERESACCSFFDFRITPSEDELLVDVRVPPERTDVLDGLARQAEAVLPQEAS